MRCTHTCKHAARGGLAQHSAALRPRPANHRRHAAIAITHTDKPGRTKLSGKGWRRPRSSTTRQGARTQRDRGVTRPRRRRSDAEDAGRGRGADATLSARRRKGPRWQAGPSREGRYENGRKRHRHHATGGHEGARVGCTPPCSPSLSIATHAAATGGRQRVQRHTGVFGTLPFHLDSLPAGSARPPRKTAVYVIGPTCAHGACPAGACPAGACPRARGARKHTFLCLFVWTGLEP